MHVITKSVTILMPFEGEEPPAPGQQAPQQPKAPLNHFYNLVFRRFKYVIETAMGQITDNRGDDSRFKVDVFLTRTGDVGADALRKIKESDIVLAYINSYNSTVVYELAARTMLSPNLIIVVDHSVNENLHILVPQDWKHLLPWYLRSQAFIELSNENGGSSVLSEILWLARDPGRIALVPFEIDQLLTDLRTAAQAVEHSLQAQSSPQNPGLVNSLAQLIEILDHFKPIQFEIQLDNLNTSARDINTLTSVAAEARDRNAISEKVAKIGNTIRLLTEPTKKIGNKELIAARTALYAGLDQLNAIAGAGWEEENPSANNLAAAAFDVVEMADGFSVASIRALLETLCEKASELKNLMVRNGDSGRQAGECDHAFSRLLKVQQTINKSFNPKDYDSAEIPVLLKTLIDNKKDQYLIDELTRAFRELIENPKKRPNYIQTIMEELDPESMLTAGGTSAYYPSVVMKYTFRPRAQDQRGDYRSDDLIADPVACNWNSRFLDLLGTTAGDAGKEISEDFQSERLRCFMEPVDYDEFVEDQAELVKMIVFGKSIKVAKVPIRMKAPSRTRIEGFELKLIGSLADLETESRDGRNVVFIARQDGLLHFRVVKVGGKVAVDTNEKKLKERAPAGEAERLREDLDALRELLHPLWSKPQVVDDQKQEVIKKLKSLTGYSDDGHQDDWFWGRSFLPAVILKKPMGRKTSIHYLYLLVVMFPWNEKSHYVYEPNGS